MIGSLLLALPLLAPALPLQEPSGNVPAFDPSQPASAETIGDEIDLSLHWLHTRFDSAKGTYGSLEADAWALLALVEAPRRYRPADGPFVAKPLANLLAAQKPDGSFASEVPALTVLYAFEVLQDEPAKA